MNTDTLMSGSTVKNHISLKTVFGYSGRQLRSDRGSWFNIEFFFKLAFFNILDTFKAGN